MLYNFVKGKHIAQRKGCYESPGEKDRRVIVIKVQAEKDKRNIVENPSERDRK